MGISNRVSPNFQNAHRMKKLLLLVILFSLGFVTWGQDYFHKVYTKKHIVSKDALRNILFKNDTLFICAAHTCTEARDSICHTIYYANTDGYLFDSIQNAFTPGNQNPMIVEDNRFIISGRNPHNNHTTFENLVFDEEGIINYSFSDSSFFNILNEGILSFDEFYFSYGDGRHINTPNDASAYIAKWNQSLDSLIWVKQMHENALETHVFDLQHTADGQMAFMHYVEDHREWSDSLDTDFHFLIKKMDSSGQIIDEFYHGNFIYASSRDFPHLLAHSNGAYYFSSLDTAGARSVNRIGFLHRVNQGLDSFEWHLLFPNDTRYPPHPEPFLDPVEYHVDDLYECKNGDILLGGLLFDRFNDFDSLTAEVPFLLRVDSETGEVLWKRVFLTPKDSTDLYTEFTPFRYAWINQIAEDDKGDIYCMGPVRRWESQEAPPRFDMFLIKINENGCFGEGTCPEDIVMNIDEIITLNPEGYFDPPYPNPVNDYLQLGHIPYEQYALYNLAGTKIRSGYYQSQINMATMQRGVYFLELMDRNQQAHTFKIIKQ